MTGKATAVAPSNIAFIKYWGTRDPERVLPCNPSVSMTLSRCVSRSTVELREAGAPLEVLLRSSEGVLRPAPPDFAARVRRHLETLRRHAGVETSFRVATENSFPAAAGIASSASGFAALTLAALWALGLDPSPEELSVLARRSGSGSAARSVLGGYVEWPPEGDDEGPARALAPAAHWDLRDVVAVVDSAPKEVSSREGHARASTSPYFARRLELLPQRLERARAAIAARDLKALGPLLEEEALDLHLIAMSSRPPIFYWKPATLTLLERVRRMRGEGLPVYATLDAGANAHLICPPEAEPEVATRVGSLPEVERLIRDGVGEGPERSEEHLL